MMVNIGAWCFILAATACSGLPAGDKPTEDIAYAYDIAQAFIPRLAEEPPPADLALSSAPLDPLPLPTFPVIMPYKVEGQAPASGLPMQAMPNLPLPNREDVSTLATKGVISNLFGAFAEAFQEIVNRQQSLLDLIYCRNCGTGGGSPWQNFLNAMANIPTLGWVMRPGSTTQGKPSGSFIAATNQDGVVSGVGGSIINNEPVVEYTFNNNQVTPVKPSSVRPSAMPGISKPPQTPSKPARLEMGLLEDAILSTDPLS